MLYVRTVRFWIAWFSFSFICFCLVGYYRFYDNPRGLRPLVRCSGCSVGHAAHDRTECGRAGGVGSVSRCPWRLRCITHVLLTCVAGHRFPQSTLFPPLFRLQHLPCLPARPRPQAGRFALAPAETTTR